MSHLRYLCLLENIGVQHTLCFFVICLSSPCLPYAASFSVLSIFDCPIGIL